MEERKRKREVITISDTETITKRRTVDKKEITIKEKETIIEIKEKEEKGGKKMQQGFEPIIGKNPHTLILGMFPSKKSREIGTFIISLH